jgi:type IX secretion system PorP/SprF family membrane protein
MKQKRKSYSILAAVCCSWLLFIPARAQDLHFSQFYEAPLLLNPALCGSFRDGIQGELNYRNQWNSIAGNGGIKSMTATVELHNMDGNWENGYLAPGLTFCSDKSGPSGIGTTEGLITIASGVYLGPTGCLSVGLQGGFGQYSVNQGSYQWGNQFVNGNFDPSAPSGVSSFKASGTYPDFSAGLSYSYGSIPEVRATEENQFKANIGLAIFHINEPSIAYFVQPSPGSELYMRYVAHGTLTYRVPDSPVSLIPALVFNMQGPATELDMGFKLRYNVQQKTRFSQFNTDCNLDIGAYYRLNDAVIVLAALQYSYYSIGLSYDLNVSQFINATDGRGAFELTLKFLNIDLLNSNDPLQHYVFN